MASFIIEGGHRLNGDLIPQGAKNEALEVLCATLLTPEEVKIYNIPDILDVNNLIQLLRDLGVTVKRIGLNAYSFKADKINLDYLDSDEFFQKGASLRGSVMIIGPLVARFGYAVLPKPGGDKIGRRRLDTHFLGIQKLGATFNYCSKAQRYEIKADKLRGSYMLLDEASVTGTANILMAAFANGQPLQQGQNVQFINGQAVVVPAQPSAFATTFKNVEPYGGAYRRYRV